VDLQVQPGSVRALVVGTRLYEIDIRIKPLDQLRWGKVIAACAGQIGSVIELLSGRLPSGVAEILTHHDRGLFPRPSEIELGCSCPDRASMCKHVAAALYGVGARLDNDPELFFVLRRVDQMDLVGRVGAVVEPAVTSKLVTGADLSALFGIEIDDSAGEGIARPARNRKKRAARTRKRPGQS